MSDALIFTTMRDIRQELMDRCARRVTDAIYCDPLSFERFKKEFKEQRMVRPEEGSVEEALEDSWPIDRASYSGIPIVTLQSLPEDVMAIVGTEKTIIRLGSTGAMYEIDGPLDVRGIHFMVRHLLKGDAGELATEIEVKGEPDGTEENESKRTE